MPTTESARSNGARLTRAGFLLSTVLVFLGAVLSVVVPALPAAAISIPPAGGHDSGVQAIDNSIDGHAELDAITCPTSAWCMAGTAGGSVLVYSAGTWSAPTRVFSRVDGLDGLSCPTTTFCMAVSYIGGYSTFSSGKWSKVVSSPAAWGVSCPTTSFCLAEEGGFGNIEAWDKGTWTLSFDTGDDSHGGMGQTSTPLSCVAGTSKDSAYVDNSDYYTTYSGSWPAMKLIPASTGGAGSVSCSEEPTGGVYQNHALYPVGQGPTCTFIDSAGYAFTLRGSKWTSEGEIDQKAGTPGLVAVSCVYARCAAVDQSRNVLYQDLFSGGVSGWSQPFALGVAGQPTAISCSSLASCVVVTARGNAVILDPDD